MGMKHYFWAAACALSLAVPPVVSGARAVKTPDPATDPLLAAAATLPNASAKSLPDRPDIFNPAPTALAAQRGPAPAGRGATDTVLEQGKDLYDKGQYVPALDKFMKVLRRNPQNQEARQYLRMVVDKIRDQKRGGGTAAPSSEEAELYAPASGRAVSRPGASMSPRPASVPLSDEEVRQRVQRRLLLSMDLKAIPGVRVDVDSKKAQVSMDTALLFTDKTGGLKEEGIPVLDRVAAWLRTFGQQPIAIHCYPEEIEDAKLNGSLFLHRYAQLYGFFVDERKMPAARFIGSGLPKGKEETADGQTNDVAVATGSARVVIVSLGGGALPEEDPDAPVTRWLEFSILPSHTTFNPEDGDWTSLDLAALNRKGVRSWSFNIFPVGKTTPLLVMDGKGNLLKRISWDGRDQKSGSFSPPGTYLCKLSATDSNGAVLSKEIRLKIQHAPTSEPVLAEKPKPVHHAAKKKANAPQLPPAPLKPAVPVTPPVAAPVPVAAEPEPAADASDPDAAGHAIWQQVIQFDP